MLCLLNVRSLKKVDVLNSKASDLLASDCYKYNIDVCVVVETFLKTKIPDTYVWIDGFSIFRRDRKVCTCRKSQCPKLHKGGGILVYTRSSMHCQYHSTSSDVESMWIKVEAENNPIFINASYAPPNATMSYMASLTDYIATEVERIQRTFPKAVIYIAGDFNRMNLEDIELSCCVSPLLSPPTRGDATLDIVLTNRPNLFEGITCFVPKVETDHMGVLVFPRKKNKPERYPCYFRLYNSFGHRKFQSLIADPNFNNGNTFKDGNTELDIMAESLEKNIQNCLQECFPLRKVIMSSKDPVWLTPKMKWLLKKKRTAIRKGQHRNSQRIDDKIKTGKMRFFCETTCKDWWKRMDSISHRKQDSKSINYKAFQPEALNQLLAQRSKRQADEVRKPAPNFVHDSKVPTLYLESVCKVMQTCKRTSPGPSGIPHFIFRDYWSVLAPHYLKVWNLSLKMGTFPQCYKEANVIPVAKVKNASDVKDVRGVSVTSIAARLFERIVHHRWISIGILTRGDTLQFAYKKGLSTIDHLLCLQFNILSHLDLKSVDGVHVLSVDFTKAFDTVEPEIAAMTYSDFINSSTIAKWLYNFTVNRTQRLVWNNVPCNFESIDIGCSQGTVGGPNIFSMLTDNVRASNPSCKILKYSDDMCCTIPCMKAPTEKEKATLHEEVTNFMYTVKSKGLSVNTTKTKLIRFCLNRFPVCDCVPSVTSFPNAADMKILGLTFQEDCQFTKHGSQMLSHLRRVLYFFKDLKLRNVSLTDLHRLFDSIVVSRIRYGISVYGADHRVLKKVDSFLDKCFAKGFCATRVSAYELLTCEDQRLMHSILDNLQHPLRPYILSRMKTRTTRQGFCRTKPRTNTVTFLNSFCNRILTL